MEDNSLVTSGGTNRVFLKLPKLRWKMWVLLGYLQNQLIMLKYLTKLFLKLCN